jgi:hypothetical protein
MKLPAMTSLPEFWTLEFDFFSTGTGGSDFTVRSVDKGEQTVWEAVFPQGESLAFRTDEIFSTTPLEGAPASGRHHMMLMARGTALKVYIDRQRLANVRRYHRRSASRSSSRSVCGPRRSR